RAARQRPARAAQAELIAHGPVDEDFAERAHHAQAERDRLALGPQDLRLLRGAATPLEDPALERRRVGALDLYGRQHVFPDTRRRQDQRRAQLAQIALHGLRALGTVDRET